MPNLDAVKNIIVVMMENRSFDHLLGYLSLAEREGRKDVDGLQADAAWKTKFTNRDGGASYQPELSTNPYALPAKFDPPHEAPNVAANLGPIAGDQYPMNGFVSGIPSTVSSDPQVRKLVMSYFGAAQAPITKFFVDNFAICDRWFSSLPAGTQPNRLMAMSGYSKIVMNQTPLPEQDLVYEWLTERNVNWCVYHQGIPFFSMMASCIPAILGTSHFRDFLDFASDIMNNPPESLPQVIFVEPTYSDAPRLGRSTDDHAPSGIADGQEFLMQVYNAVASSVEFWKGSVLIIDYDEHGGFFDHVSPPLVQTDPPPGVSYPSFKSLGVRTPGYVISPFVRPKSVSHNILDHTSVLKLIAEKFGKGSYSEVVDKRPVESLSAVLDFTNPINAPPAPPALNDYFAARPPAPVNATVPATDTALTQAFNDATYKLKNQGAGPDHPKFGPLMSQIPPIPPPSPSR